MRCIPLTLTITSVLAFSLTAPMASARIGESRSALERRLIGSDTGIEYRDLSHRQFRNAPYRRIFFYYRDHEDRPKMTGPDPELAIYYKTEDGSTPRTRDISGGIPSEGWNLHVIYLQNTSQIEYYERLGRGAMSEFERNAILSLNSGGSRWTMVEEDDQTETLFGYDFETESGEIRAKQERGNILIFRTNYDKELLKMQLVYNEMGNEEDKDLLPTSIKGF